MTGGEGRAALAHRLAEGTATRLGEITLAAHQHDAAVRLRALLREHRGALLADDVGLGKTFVALAVARTYERVLVIHPAGLRPMWADALRRAQGAARLVSYESLSRRASAAAPWDLVILDEAHHARSPTTRRYPRIAALTARAHVLLLSATPLANRARDVRALLALFLGERACTLDEATLRGLIVRRTAQTSPDAPLPDVVPVQWVDVPDDDTLLARLRAIPPPIPPADGGDGGALVTLGLVRQWASSGAALRAALHRGVARALALEHALEGGRRPTRRELAAWTFTDDALQLGMPELLTDGAPLGHHEAGPLRESLVAFRDALRDVLQYVEATSDHDAHRAARLLELQHRHAGEKLLAFTEYAETARACWRLLRTRPGVALLTARGGVIASGAVSRADMLRRFAPAGQRSPPPRAIEAISLLITTDLLAEGVDLRDATVVVHLDLPWSPARMAQRVGRARRLGSAAKRIVVYAFRPPRTAEALLTMERRLRAKVAAARATVGWSHEVLPGDGADAGSSPPRTAAERMSALLDRLGAWRGESRAGERPPAACDGVPVVATVAAACEGWLALVSVEGHPRLVARLEARVDDGPDLLERAVPLVEGAPDQPACATRITRATDEARAWAAARAAEHCIASPASRGATRHLLRRLARVRARMTHDERGAAATLLAAARAIATAPRSAGLDHELDQLTRDATLDDHAWLQAVVARGGTASLDLAPAAVEVLILFAPATSGRDPDPATPS